MRLKLQLAALFLGACTCSSFAQEAQTEEVVFNRHGSIYLQAGAAYTRGETKFKDLISPAAALSFDYRFTPVWGLRVGVSGWEARGAWVNPLTVYKYKYLQGNVEAVVDLANLFCKYNYKRVFNPYFFLGVGVNGAFDNDEAVALADAGYNLEYLWRDNKISPVGRLGIGADFRLCKRLYFNLEVNANLLTDKFNSKKAGNSDWQFNALGGFVIKLGKPYKKVAAPEPEPVVEEPVQKPEPKPEVKKEEPKPVKTVEKVEPATEDIFFAINSSQIRESEVAKVDKLVAYLKAHPKAKVNLCGYADKATGNATINERLSRQRSEAVAAALKAKGIDASRILTDYKGDTVQPFQVVEQNRVTICIAE